MGRPRAEHTLTRLRTWVEKTGWAGHDPFDVRAHPIYLRLSRAAGAGSAAGRVALSLLYRLERRHPSVVRRLLPSAPTTNAKGMGLFARAYAMLEATGDDEAGVEASRRLDWLRSHAARGYAGVSWGYPFDWQSRIFVPRGTPSAVVTATVGDAFRPRFERSGDDADLLHGIATFIADGLNRSVDTPTGLCFSYTPLDDMCVHNANVIAAEYLLWAGHAFDHASWRELGRRAFAYTIHDQEASGAWDYWGPPDRGRRPRHVDAYHTGFVLRMLLRAHALTSDQQYLTAATLGFDYMKKALIEDGHPRATELKRYPVDGHAIAEVLLTCQAFEELDSHSESIAEAVLAWALAHMWDGDGFFHYLWWPNGANRLPMMRWVQAWMFLALAATVTGARRP